jgi:hypothetical protein
MLLVALAAAAAPLTLPPIDECAKDPSFVQFRTELRTTIKRRDKAALMQILADDFWSGRGEIGVRRDRFVAGWAGKEDDWNELGAILDLGCVMRGERAWSPSFDHQLYDQRKGYESLTSTIALPGAVVRSRPKDRAPIIARSNWLVLTELEESKPGWIGVTLTDGRKGFVKEAMMAATGMTLSFGKSNGRWVMTGMTSGD